MANMQILAAEKRMKENKILALQAREAELKDAKKDFETRADSIQTEDELSVLTREIDQNQGELSENEAEQIQLRTEIADIEGKINDFQKRVKAVDKAAFFNVKNRGDEGMEEKRAQINEYIRTRSADGLVKDDIGVLIPVDISYTPADEVKTLLDLSKYVTKVSVSTGSGKYPVRKKASATLNTVAELEKNPKLAGPSFNEVEWKAETYRGAIAVSQESIDDSAVDLMAIVAKDAAEQKLNTVNSKISAILKTFTKVTATSVDRIKQIINKDLDRAYNRMIIASSSFYHAVDTLKDKDGRYLLQPDIKSPTGHIFLGIPIEIVNDTDLGADGEANAFIGDVRRAVLFADRKDLGITWADHEIYGQYLRAGMRFGVTKADDKAGYLVKFEPEDESEPVAP